MSFAPAILIPQLNSSTAVTHTGSTSKTAVLTQTIKGGQMEANDMLIVIITWFVTNNANLKTLDIDWGATNVLNIAASGQAGQTTLLWIHNRNSQSSQISGQLTNSALFGANGNALVTATENTANNVTLTYSVTLATGTDSFVFENVTPFIWKAGMP